MQQKQDGTPMRLLDHIEFNASRTFLARFLLRSAAIGASELLSTLAGRPGLYASAVPTACANTPPKIDTRADVRMQRIGKEKRR
jgi:hypothetical protein